MLHYTAQSIRIQILHDFLQSQPLQRASFQELQLALNSQLKAKGYKTINTRSLEADLHQLRKLPNLELQHIRVARKHYYQLLETKSKVLSNPDQLLQHEMMRQLGHAFGLPGQAPNSLQEAQLVFSMNALNDNGQSMELAVSLLKAIQQAYCVQFLYKPAFSTYKSRLQLVAPLQIRFYEGRFYLVATEWSERLQAPKSSLKIYAFDLIEDFVVVPVQSETDDGSAGELQSFDWIDLAKNSGLSDYFTHCLGVARYKDSQPEYVRIKFTDWAIAYVKNRSLHRSQRIVVDHQAYIVVELYIYRTYELDMLLSKFREFGSEVR
ncbi:MAG: hypothetical protein RLZZ301_1677 [Bacteroidota bacterium]|jgi:hypothetical protein